MKRTVISVLAVAGFGATIIGANDADACGWESNLWVLSTNVDNIFTTSTNGFKAHYYIDEPSVQPASASATLTVNVTGLLGVNADTCHSDFEVPTCHQAWAVCQDSSWLIGPLKCATSVGNPNNNSNTSVGGSYWTNPSNPTQGTYTGFCPSGAGHQMVGGAVSIYNY